MMWGTTYTTSTLRYVDNVAVGRDQYQSFSHVLCLRQCNYGFSFPNYLDRMFGTYENGERWLSEDERKQLGLPVRNKKKA